MDFSTGRKWVFQLNPNFSKESRRDNVFFHVEFKTCIKNFLEQFLDSNFGVLESKKSKIGI